MKGEGMPTAAIRAANGSDRRPLCGIVNRDRAIATAVARRYLSEGADVVSLVQSGGEPAPLLDEGQESIRNFDSPSDLPSLLALNELRTPEFLHGPTTFVLDANFAKPPEGKHCSADVLIDETLTLLRAFYDAAGAVLRSVGGGSVIIIGPAPSGVANEHWAYSIVRSAVVSFTSVFAEEEAEYRTRANAVLPGLIAADGEGSPTDHVDIDVAMVPLRRKARAAEVANAVRFLGSERASYMNGAVLVVDGGLTASSGGDFFPRKSARASGRQRL
jgi:hypothetical protein